MKRFFQKEQFHFPTKQREELTALFAKEDHEKAFDQFKSMVSDTHNALVPKIKSCCLVDILSLDKADTAIYQWIITEKNDIDVLLNRAIKESKNPLPQGVLALYYAYCSNAFEDDLLRTPQRAAQILCTEYLRKVEDIYHYDIKARETFATALLEIGKKYPEDPAINHYLAKLYFYRKDGEQASKCAIIADTSQFVRPDLLYDIGILLHDETARKKLLYMAVNRGSILACDALIKLDLSIKETLRLHACALTTAFLQCEQKAFVGRLTSITEFMLNYVTKDSTLAECTELVEFCEAMEVKCDARSLKPLKDFMNNNIAAIRNTLAPRGSRELLRLANKGNIVAITACLQKNQGDTSDLQDVIIETINPTNLIHYFEFANRTNGQCNFIFDELSILADKIPDLTIAINVYHNLLQLRHENEPAKDVETRLTKLYQNNDKHFREATDKIRHLYLLEKCQQDAVSSAEINAKLKQTDIKNPNNRSDLLQARKGSAELHERIDAIVARSPENRDAIEVTLKKIERKDGPELKRAKSTPKMSSNNNKSTLERQSHK